MINPENPKLTINVELFQQVKEAILAFPRAFSMRDFIGTNGTMEYNPKTDPEPHCGSACCLAGWAVIIGDQISLQQALEDGIDVPERAQELLGLTEEQAAGIFYWSPPSKSLGMVTSKEAARMIDRFLKKAAASN